MSLAESTPSVLIAAKHKSPSLIRFARTVLLAINNPDGNIVNVMSPESFFLRKNVNYLPQHKS